MRFSPFCLSSYLAFRYVAKPGHSWCDGVSPDFPTTTDGHQQPVSTSREVEDALRAALAPCRGRGDVGVLLSGGVDSAILAAFLSPGTRAYTIRFDAPNAVDETAWATRYARATGLQHRTVTVSWEDYLAHADVLMEQKRSPLHAVEVGLYRAAQEARLDGVTTLVIGNGADSTFGGLDKLLSRDWTFNEFVRRYTFLAPSEFLREPADMLEIYEPYRQGDSIDVAGFLKVVHGLGVVQAFDNALAAGGCSSLAPYECLRLQGPLDLERIRNGESKYLLRELFRRVYPDLPIPEKIPFSRPMDEWLHAWRGPIRKEFLHRNSITELTGDQKWLLWCLHRFLELVEPRRS